MDKLLRVDKLNVGMILDEDVIDKNTGVVLVSKDIIITQNLIDRLVNSGIEEVYIKKEKILQKIFEEKYNEPLTKQYAKIEDGLENIFIKIKSGEELDPEELLQNMKEFVQEIKNERDILTQIRLLKNKDDYTFNHSIAVSILAISLGKWLNYSNKEIMDLGIAAIFHDLGKLKIGENIINKPGKLTDEEFEIMKNHSLYSSQILLESGRFNEDIISGVLEHHERMDGTGYPNKIEGDKIHRYAKVIAICDIYHALTSRRVYKDKENPLKVADYIRQESFSRLDPYMTQVFLNNISKFYVGNRVVLSTGEIGEIIYIHPQHKTKPIVKVGDKYIDFIQEKDIEVVDIII